MAFEVRFEMLGCLFLIVLHLNLCSSRTTKLFGADPAGGLWGVEVDTSSGNRARLLSKAGYPQSLFNKQIATASYDPISKQVLLETSNPRGLYYGPLCKSTSEPPRMLARTIDVFSLSDPIIGDGVGLEASAFTLYDSRIYFLLNGEYVDEWGDYTRVLQVRVFQPCEKCASAKKSKDAGDGAEFTFQEIVKCSRVVVNIINELIEDDAQIKAGKHMKIVKINGVLTFFFQTGNITISDSGRGKASMSVWQADKTGGKWHLFSREIDSTYGDWSLHSQGAIDYHEQMLCWSYPDTVYCGDLVGNQLRRGAEQLPVAQGAISGVCQGDMTDKLHIVSGVAVADSGEERSFVFGCYPQVQGTGGTGIMAKDETNPVSVQVGETKMNAGSVFIVDMLSDSCDFEPEPKICLGPDDPKPEAEEPDTDPEPVTEPVDETKKKKVPTATLR